MNQTDPNQPEQAGGHEITVANPDDLIIDTKQLYNVLVSLPIDFSIKLPEQFEAPDPLSLSLHQRFLVSSYQKELITKNPLIPLAAIPTTGKKCFSRAFDNAFPGQIYCSNSGDSTRTIGRHVYPHRRYDVLLGYQWYLVRMIVVDDVLALSGCLKPGVYIVEWSPIDPPGDLSKALAAKAEKEVARATEAVRIATGDFIKRSIIVHIHSAPDAGRTDRDACEDSEDSTDGCSSSITRGSPKTPSGVQLDQSLSSSGFSLGSSSSGAGLGSVNDLNTSNYWDAGDFDWAAVEGEGKHFLSDLAETEDDLQRFVSTEVSTHPAAAIPVQETPADEHPCEDGNASPGHSTCAVYMYTAESTGAVEQSTASPVSMRVAAENDSSSSSDNRKVGGVVPEITRTGVSADQNSENRNVNAAYADPRDQVTKKRKIGVEGTGTEPTLEDVIRPAATGLFGQTTAAGAMKATTETVAKLPKHYMRHGAQATTRAGASAVVKGGTHAVLTNAAKASLGVAVTSLVIGLAAIFPDIYLHQKGRIDNAEFKRRLLEHARTIRREVTGSTLGSLLLALAIPGSATAVFVGAFVGSLTATAVHTFRHQRNGESDEKAKDRVDGDTDHGKDQGKEDEEVALAELDAKLSALVLSESTAEQSEPEEKKDEPAASGTAGIADVAGRVIATVRRFVGWSTLVEKEVSAERVPSDMNAAVDKSQAPTGTADVGGVSVPTGQGHEDPAAVAGPAPEDQQHTEVQAAGAGVGVHLQLHLCTVTQEGGAVEEVWVDFDALAAAAVATAEMQSALTDAPNDAMRDGGGNAETETDEHESAEQPADGRNDVQCPAVAWTSAVQNASTVDAALCSVETSAQAGSPTSPAPGSNVSTWVWSFLSAVLSAQSNSSAPTAESTVDTSAENADTSTSLPTPTDTILLEATLTVSTTDAPPTLAEECTAGLQEAAVTTPPNSVDAQDEASVGEVDQVAAAAGVARDSQELEPTTQSQAAETHENGGEGPGNEETAEMDSIVYCTETDGDVTLRDQVPDSGKECPNTDTPVPDPASTATNQTSEPTSIPAPESALPVDPSQAPSPAADSVAVPTNLKSQSGLAALSHGVMAYLFGARREPRSAEASTITPVPAAVAGDTRDSEPGGTTGASPEAAETGADAVEKGRTNSWEMVDGLSTEVPEPGGED